MASAEIPSVAARIECPAKINLSLRVTGKLPSGYHELCSLFYKITPLDYLTINRATEDNVRVFFRGSPMEIEGRNILLKALDALRAGNAAVPPFGMTLDKRVPPGTGLGAGSGDAAALLSRLESEGFPARARAAEIGADVSFLCAPCSLALARGLGEILRPIEPVPELTAVVAIPRWRCRTPEMYRALDLRYGSRWPLEPREAESEAAGILRGLACGRVLGLLPNDFTPVLLGRRPEYAALFRDFERNGAIAWGVSGSGAAAFALWPPGRFSGYRAALPWVEDVLIFPRKGEVL